MEDPLISESFRYFGGDLEHEWDKYVQRFALSSKDERVYALKMADNWLSEPKPTKETASMWQRKRTLEALHFRLDALGR